MIVTVTLNPCIDKSSSVPKLEPESKLRCTEVKREPGGGGINVSKALKKLGCSSVALFPSGGNNGNMLCQLLQEMEIPFQAFNSSEETRENWIVLEEAGNLQYRFTFPGRPIPEQCIKRLIDQLAAFSPSYVVASGSLPAGLPDYFYGLIVKKANALGARCIVDTSGNALQALRGKHSFLIKPNLAELCSMLGIKHLEKNEIPDAAQQAISDGYAEIIVLSMGATGAWLVTSTEKYFAAAPRVEKKSTVGAGDSMLAGITYALQKKMSMAEVIAMGVACGSAATMNPGTELFHAEEAYALFESIRISAGKDQSKNS